MNFRLEKFKSSDKLFFSIKILYKNVLPEKCFYLVLILCHVDQLEISMRFSHKHTRQR